MGEGFEGFDVNDPEDRVLAEHYLSTGEATLPPVAQAAYIADRQGGHRG